MIYIKTEDDDFKVSIYGNAPDLIMEFGSVFSSLVDILVDEEHCEHEVQEILIEACAETYAQEHS